MCFTCVFCSPHHCYHHKHKIIIVLDIRMCEKFCCYFCLPMDNVSMCENNSISVCSDLLLTICANIYKKKMMIMAFVSLMNFYYAHDITWNSSNHVESYDGWSKKKGHLTQFLRILETIERKLTVIYADDIFPFDSFMRIYQAEQRDWARDEKLARMKKRKIRRKKNNA